MNLLNDEAVRLYLQGLIRPHNKTNHVGKWFRTILRRHLMQDASLCTQCITETEANSATHRMLVAVLNTPPFADMFSGLRTITLKEEEIASHPGWVREALSKNDLWKWAPPEEAQHAKFMHWQDYMEGLPERDIHHDVKSMDVAVRKADVAARRQELIARSGGVFPVEFEFSNPDVCLFRLETKDSFLEESRLMDHCVGRSNGYYTRRISNPIFSLRAVTADAEVYKSRTDRPVFQEDGDALVPLATFEVALDTRRIVQSRGYHDRAPSTEIRLLLEEWFAHQGYTTKSLKDCDDYEDDDDYEEDDYEDEDPGEDYD